jgi:hypothetical protein
MRKLAAALVVLAVAAACSDKADPAKLHNSLKPDFAPDPTADTASTSTTAASGGATTTTSGAGSPVTTTAPAAAVEVSITDPSNDTTPALTEQPPAWADLLGARLIRSAGGFELRVRLGGGTAPQNASDEDHTMNIASFYDVDGDGSVDYEVWANVASSGWGSSYFDDVHRRAKFQDDSGVRVTPEGDEVVFRFPLSHLADTSRFRWSLASEWGRYEVLGTLASVRDQAPDNDGAARFPEH